jgi:hypothetical protein
VHRDCKLRVSLNYVDFLILNLVPFSDVIGFLECGIDDKDNEGC